MVIVYYSEWYNYDCYVAFVAVEVNDAFVDHTILIADQVDALLHSMRGYYLKTRSLQETESFIRSLGVCRT